MSIPVTVPVFAELQNDIDFILAEDQNDPNDEITALATLVGMPGSLQSYNTDFLTFLLNGIFGCGVKYSSTTAVIVEAGQVLIPNATNTIKELRSKTTTSSLTLSDLDTGVAFTNSTAHYVYATGDTAVATPVYKISTNASAPTGFTNYRRIGGFYVDGSGNIIFVWSDSRPTTKPGDVIYERKVLTTSIDSTTNTIPLDNTAPQTASEGKNFAALNTVIVPTSTTDIVEITIVASQSNGTSNVQGLMYLAKDSDADGLTLRGVAGNADNLNRIDYSYVPGAVTPITFKVYFGGHSAGTAYFNSSGATTVYGMRAMIHIRVIKGALSA